MWKAEERYSGRDKVSIVLLCRTALVVSWNCNGQGSRKVCMFWRILVIVGKNHLCVLTFGFLEKGVERMIWYWE